MKYISFIVVCYLLCGTKSFDMKYSLLKHKWQQFTPSLIASDNIDKYRTILYDSSEKASLKSTDLEGGVTLSDSYILAAKFKIVKMESPLCLFKMERKGVQKLALCLEPAGNDAVTITLDSATIPEGKLKFAYKIKKDEWTQLLLSVNKTDVTQIINCNVIEEKGINISNLIRLTDDMDLSLPSGSNFELQIRELDLYSPVDVTTVTSLCPNLESAQLRGMTGAKGDKGDRGPKGEIGSQGPIGERGFGLIGQKGERGVEGTKGERGDFGPAGPMGQPGIGIKGDEGVRGEKGERGEPGLPAPPAPSCPATVVSPTATAELDSLKSILVEIKTIFKDFIDEKKEQMKYFAEVNTRCNERLTDAERNIVINSNNIETLKNAMLTESQL